MVILKTCYCCTSLKQLARIAGLYTLFVHSLFIVGFFLPFLDPGGKVGANKSSSNESAMSGGAKAARNGSATASSSSSSSSWGVAATADTIMGYNASDIYWVEVTRRICDIFVIFSCGLLFLGLRKEWRLLFIPWIVANGIEVLYDISMDAYLLQLGTTRFEPKTAFIFTLQFFGLSIHMYLVLGVVSLYQSNFEPTAQFDHRHLLLPAPTGGGGGGGKGGNNRSGSERKKSGDKIGIRGGKCILPSGPIVAADGESAVTETAASAAAAPTKVHAVDASGRPVTFLEVIHEVEMQVLSSSDYSNGDNSNAEGNNANINNDSSNNGSAGSSSEEERRQFTSTEEEELTNSSMSQSRTEKGGTDPKGTEVPHDSGGDGELARLRDGGGGGEEEELTRELTANKFWPKAKIVLKALTVTTTTNSAAPTAAAVESSDVPECQILLNGDKVVRVVGGDEEVTW